jgi:hypothetical protein
VGLIPGSLLRKQRIFSRLLKNHLEVIARVKKSSGLFYGWLHNVPMIQKPSQRDEAILLFLNRI